MGKELADKMQGEAQDMLDKLSVLADGLDSRRAKNPAQSAAKRAMKKCLAELQSRVDYAKPTTRSCGQIEKDFDRALTSWNDNGDDETAL